MTRTGQAAIDYALSRVGGSMPASGYCLAWTREPFAIPALYASAVDAWFGCEDRRRGDRTPPPAVPVWFDSSSVYEHVAFWCGADVGIVTTFNADIRLMPTIEAAENTFGPYAGWGPSLNEVDVWATAPPPPVEQEEDDVKAFIYTTGTDTWWLYDSYRKRKLAPGEPQRLVELGLIPAETLAAGPKWLPPDEVEAIRDDA